jgi:undecaprenyl diphosphate synthase
MNQDSNSVWTNHTEFELHKADLKVPKFDKVPEHVAIIMDGNGRWATERGLDRTEGHKVGEKVLMDVVAGAIEAGVKELSLYTFSTENWHRSPKEVKFLMGFSREIIHKRTDLLNQWGVKIRWCGREPKLWKSVYRELKTAEQATRNNPGLILNMCINYGGQIEIVDAVNRILNQPKLPKSITPQNFRKYLYQPQIRDVDLLIRTAGEMRISNFLLYEIAYAEFYFDPKKWPDYSRLDLWKAIAEFGTHNRTYGQ